MPESSCFVKANPGKCIGGKEDQQCQGEDEQRMLFGCAKIFIVCLHYIIWSTEDI